MPNKIIYNGKECVNQYDWKGKTVVKFVWVETGKECFLKSASQNAFTGTFSTPDKEAEFMSITTSVAANQFKDEPGLTSISLPSVTSIGAQAFANSPLTSVSLPEAVTIGEGAFTKAKLANLSLPKATTIGSYAFSASFFRNGVVNLPEVTTIGASAFFHFYYGTLIIPKIQTVDRDGFRNFANDATNKVTMPYTFINKSGAIFNDGITKMKITWINSPNKFTGTWSSKDKENQFLGIEHRVDSQEFKDETGITGIEILQEISMGSEAFAGVPLTSIKLPKFASIYATNAFNGVINAPTTEVWMDHSINTAAIKDTTFGAGNWDQITFHWVDNFVIPTGTATAGRWSPGSKQYEFNAITTTIADGQFASQPGVTTLSHVTVTNIGQGAFSGDPLVVANFPKADTIGDGAFVGTVNDKYTHVILKAKFNTDAEKDRLFGAGNWNNITFHWVSANAFTGTFSTPTQQAAFEAITTTVAYSQFSSDTGLTSVSLPEVTSIGRFAFSSSLTSVNIPKAETIGDGAFTNIVNASTTHVTLKAKFDTTADKDRIFVNPFGAPTWSHITFTWV